MRQIGCGVAMQPSRILDPITILEGTCVDWWRADVGVTLASGVVSVWAGRKAGLSLAQGTAGARPSPIADCTPNHRPGIRFNLAHYLQVSTALVQPCGVIIVAKWTAQAGATYLTAGGPTGGANIVNGGGAAGYYAYAGNYNIWKAITDATWQTLEAVFDGASSYAAVNFGAKTTANPGGNNLNGLTVGAAANGAAAALADVSDVILINAAMTDAQRAMLAVYCQERTGY